MVYLRKYCFVVLLLFLVSCGNKVAQDFIEEGIKHTEDQEYDKAIKSFKKAISTDPENSLAHYTLGGIYTYKNMNLEAVEEFKKAIALDPEYPDPHYSLGYVYEKLEKKEQAEQEYANFKRLKGK